MIWRWGKVMGGYEVVDGVGEGRDGGWGVV